MGWLLEFIVWILPNAVADVITARRHRKFDPNKYGEARFDSRTGNQIK